jgi:hypothetical protein
MRNLIFILAFGMLFVCCKKEKSQPQSTQKETPKTEKTLKEYMVDSWETTYLKIEMPTFYQTDSIRVIEETYDENSARRAQSIYNADGTFSAWFVDGQGEDTGQTSVGEWDVKGDSLYISFVYQGRDMQVRYFIEKTTEGFYGRSIYDWDNDGEFIDTLQMKTKRIVLGN